MPQAFLGSNPGTLVRDSLEPVLKDSTSVVADETGAWVAVNFPQDVVAAVDVGVVGGTGVTCAIEVQGADDAAGLNTVSYGRFANIDETDDSQLRVMAVHIAKAFVRVDIVVAGTTPDLVIPTTLRPKDYWQGNLKTA